MAERTVVNDRAPQRSGGLAAGFSFLILILSIAALIFSFIALHRANNAVRQAEATSSQVTDMNKRLDNALGSQNKASSGAGTGPNSQQSIPSSNPQPNGNGQ